MEDATCHFQLSGGANEAPSRSACCWAECIFNGGVKRGDRGMSMLGQVTGGVDQWRPQDEIVGASLAESSRCLGRLLRCGARTLGTQRMRCYDDESLFCASKPWERRGSLILGRDGRRAGCTGPAWLRSMDRRCSRRAGGSRAFLDAARVGRRCRSRGSPGVGGVGWVDSPDLLFCRRGGGSGGGEFLWRMMSVGPTGPSSRL